MTELAIIEMTNAYRAGHKASAVTPDKRLAAAARAYAEYLARTGKFSHEADGRDPGKRAESAGYSYCAVAENLALHLDSRGFASRQLARLAMDGWIASPGHQKNLVAPYVTEIGVAVARAPGPHPKYISVQLFGRPIKLRYRFRIANRAKSQVSYRLGGQRLSIAPSTIVAHAACEPAKLSFDANVAAKKADYETRDGQLYTLTGGAARIAVDVSASAAGR